ncbi:MAG: precorrin-3B synthase [Pseudonocardia sp.]|nr:precorrin-3B synthase [Pseudonocardia sp.]
MPFPTRTRADACPGVLAPHDAADGALARVRLPGGVVTAAQLRVLAACADDLGDGAAHLTSRGNLQLRGLDREDPRLVTRLVGAGLIPAPSHERVRNVLASPLSGLHGGLADVRGLAAAFDTGLCARPALAALPGRILFAFDDGRGDVAAEQPDLGWVATGARLGYLQVGGVRTGIEAGLDDAGELLLAAAEAFLTLRAADGVTAWRVRELADAPGRIAAALRPALDHRPGATGRDERGPGYPDGDPAALIGPLGDCALGLAPVLGELSSAQLRALADSGEHVLVTPWRTIVAPSPAPGARDALRAAGFVVDPGHPALGISACAGSPGCAKSHADVRSDARALIAIGTVSTGNRLTAHVVGCDRRCGAPHGPHLDVVARPDGTYEIDGTPVPDLHALENGA